MAASASTVTPLKLASPMLSTTFISDHDMILDLQPDSASVGHCADLSNYEEGPIHLGQLLWGKMKGFPYWPCFVTRAPDGSYKRCKTTATESYHVQFFNWNDESGWIAKYLPWCSVDDLTDWIHAKASPRTELPFSRTIRAKWDMAVISALNSASWTASERLTRLAVPYITDNATGSEISDTSEAKQTDVGSFIKSQSVRGKRKKRLSSSLSALLIPCSPIHTVPDVAVKELVLPLADRTNDDLYAFALPDCTVQMTPLPSLFLTRSTVRVGERGGQLFVWDSVTGFFLAKMSVRYAD